MGTKERVAGGLEKLARMVPGIESYQDKEALRDADKQLRQTFADRLDRAARRLGRIILKIQREGRLEHLDLVGRLERWLQGTADTIRFASYGYSGFFAAVKMDEKNIRRLYEFDVGLADAVDVILDRVGRLEEIDRIKEEHLGELEADISALENQIRERMVLFRADPSQ